MPRRHRHVVAALLACVLALPLSPAYALRPAGPESSVKNELAAGLEELDRTRSPAAIQPIDQIVQELSHGVFLVDRRVLKTLLGPDSTSACVSPFVRSVDAAKLQGLLEKAVPSATQWPAETRQELQRRFFTPGHILLSLALERPVTRVQNTLEHEWFHRALNTNPSAVEVLTQGYRAMVHEDHLGMDVLIYFGSHTKEHLDAGEMWAQWFRPTVVEDRVRLDEWAAFKTMVREDLTRYSQPFQEAVRLVDDVLGPRVIHEVEAAWPAITARLAQAYAAGLEEPTTGELAAVRGQLEKAWAVALDVRGALTTLAPGTVWLAPSADLQALQAQQGPLPILHAPWQPPGFVQRATQMAVVELPEGQETLIIHVYGLGIRPEDLAHHVGYGLPERGVQFEVHSSPAASRDLWQRPGVVVHTEEFLRSNILDLPDDYPRLGLKNNVLIYSPAALALVALAPERLSLDRPLDIEGPRAVPFTVDSRRYAAVFFA